MRILIISTFFPPLNSIASLRPYSWAKHWSAAGHDVTVLTTEKNEDNATALKSPLEGFKVVSVPLPSFVSKLKNNNKGSSAGGKKGLVKRLFDYLRFERGVFNAARMPDFTDLWIAPAFAAIQSQGPWDLVISTAGPYSVHILAHRLKKKNLARQWIADYRDTWSNNYIYSGIFPFNRIERWLEHRLLKRADLVTTVSDPLADSFFTKFGCKNVQTIENGFDTDDVKDISHESIFPADGKYRIVHTGSIYLGKRDPTPLFQAIQRLQQAPMQRHLLDRLEILFVGPRQANLETLINEYGVANWVKLVGFVSREDALRMQRDAHALLFLAWNDPSVDGILTGKIFEYLFSKTPIIAVGAGELEASQKLILEAGAGFAFHSVDEIEEYLTTRLNGGKKDDLLFDETVLNRYSRKTLANKLLEMVQR